MKRDVIFEFQKFQNFNITIKLSNEHLQIIQIFIKSN